MFEHLFLAEKPSLAEAIAQGLAAQTGAAATKDRAQVVGVLRPVLIW